jgi:hypothetical protein
MPCSGGTRRLKKLEQALINHSMWVHGRNPSRTTNERPRSARRLVDRNVQREPQRELLRRITSINFNPGNHHQMFL